MSDMDETDTFVERLIRVGYCAVPSFSPDGQRIAFISDLSGVPQVWIVPAKGGWPVQVTSGSDPAQAVAWSSQGDWLAVQIAPGGGMNSQVFVVREDGTGLRRITSGGFDTNILGGWTRSGQAVFLASSLRNPAVMDAYLCEIGTEDKLRKIADNPGIGGLRDVSRDGRRAILNRMAQRGDNNLFLIDLADRSETVLTPHEGSASFGGGYFSQDGTAVYLTSNRAGEMTALASVAVSTDGAVGGIEVLAERDDADLDEIAVSDDGGAIALMWNASGRSELGFYDVARRAATPGPTLPGEEARSVSFSLDGRMLAFSLGGAGQPTDLWTLNRESGELRQVTYAPHPGIALEELVRPQMVAFDAHDGLRLSGWLYRSRGQHGPGPLVLSFHGGPEGQERPVFNHYYQALLSMGIGVFAPNVRGSSGFGKTFVNLDNGALRIDAIRDIQACAEFALEAGFAESGRLGIMGVSYGGYMTMAGVTEHPELFAAAVDIVGLVNFETYFAQTEPWMAAISKQEYGDPDTEMEMLRSLSPINKIDRAVAPTLVMHGANDTNVPVGEAEQVVENLRRREVPVEYILFPDEGHAIVKSANRIAAARAVAQWFGKYLQGRKIPG